MDDTCDMCGTDFIQLNKTRTLAQEAITLAEKWGWSKELPTSPVAYISHMMDTQLDGG